jgi:phosphotransacetylase
MEDSSVSMIEWIRQLFSGEGEEARKINALTERRAKLANRRDRLYEDVSRLEERESDLMVQGRETASATVKRRVATQVKQLRDDMERLNAAARMVGQQIDVISTHIHNLTMIQQGQAAKLPSSEEITQDAVRAEEMLEQLGAEVELASSLGGVVKETSLSQEEMAILAELEGPAPVREEIKPQPQVGQAQAERPARVEEPEGREPQAS